MSQVVTPEEMAALFEGLREAEDGPGSLYCHAPQETAARGQVFSEPGRIDSFQKLSAWLMELADLRWPHL
jgi:translation elongation factor EF-Tu-like GTPase